MSGRAETLPIALAIERTGSKNIEHLITILDFATELRCDALSAAFASRGSDGRTTKSAAFDAFDGKIKWMTTQTSFKRLILQAVLRNVSPMVIRVLAVPDYLDLPNFDEIFRSILGWDSLGFIFRVHGQEFNSFRRRTKSKRGHAEMSEFPVHRISN